MKVLVTGGAGFLGRHLVRRLLSQGDDVRVLDNFRRAARLPMKDVEVIEGDIRDEDTVRRSLHGAEAVYHLAAQSNVIGAALDADYSFTTNVTGTYNVLKAAQEQGVRRVIFSSSREVYGEPEELPVPETAPLDPKNAYGASKVAGEAYCHVWNDAQMEVQVLRFANVYGPGDRDRVIPLWVEAALSGQALEMFGGEQLIDFVWIGTAVDALLSAATCEVSGPVNVGSGSGTSLQTLAERVLQLAGSESELLLLPAREAEVVRFVADVSRMKSVLKVSPISDPLGHLDQCIADAGAPDYVA